MTPNALKQFIATYTDEVWNQHKVDAIDTYYARDYVHRHVSMPDVVTLGDYKGWATDLQSGLSNLRVWVDDLIATDAMAVKRWTATGVHTASLAGIVPTHAQVQFCGVSIYRFANDRIAESWYVYDLFGLLQQLGALPAPQAATA